MGGGVADIGTLNLGGGTNSNGAFVYNAGTLRVDSLTLASTSHTTINADIDFRNRAGTGGTSVAVGNALVEVTGSAHATLGGAMSINSRTLTKTGSGTLTIGGPLTDSGSPTFTVNDGTLVMTSPAGGNLTVNANSATRFESSQSLKALNVGDGATATVAADGGRVLNAAALNLNSSGTLDLTNNSMAIPSSAASGVVGYLHSAYAGGAWTGTGLTSSTARDRGDHAGGLGYADDGTQMLVKYTWAGDLNLDGRMNGDDYTLIDRQVAQYGLNSAGVWKDGDVNYDGVVDAGDYMAIDTAYFYSNGSLAPGILAVREAEFGTGYVNQLMAAVPEPGSLGVLAGAAGVALAGRRRRRGMEGR
jgi:autotransporter-associated beta strand protein